jgi:predicted ATP-binding protein involved in virulence
LIDKVCNAIIEELEIQFSDGLTVLSGETGSGKSIIIDAIGQLIVNIKYTFDDSLFFTMSYKIR